jgi:hypothetical protein
MQIKHYDILDTADMAVVQAWVDEPNHRCIIITKGSTGAVTRSLGVSQPEGQLYVFALTESALAGMIQETPEPE